MLPFFASSALDAAIIKGQVINYSADSAAVGGKSVRLLAIKQGIMAPMQVGTTTSSSDGMFRFDVGHPDSLLNYFASVDHSGITFYSQGAHFHTGVREQLQDVVVFDSTHSAAGVEIFMSHIFVQDRGNFLSVRESHVLNNPTKFAITDVFDVPQIGTATLRFSLPANAYNIQAAESGEANRLIQHGQYLYDTAVFLPGNQQVSFAYDLPWQNNFASLVTTVPFTTRSFNVFIDNPGLSVSSSVLQDNGPFAIRGQNYRRFGAEDIPPNRQIDIHISRPTDSADQSPSAALLVTALLLLGGFLYSTFKRPAKTAAIAAADKEILRRQKVQLLRQIAELDVNPEYDADVELQQQRQELLESLVGIELQLQASSKKTSKTSRK
jgi:hypothetical protein